MAGRRLAGVLARDLLSMLVGLAVLAAFGEAFFSPVRVTGHSMEPALFDGDLVLLNRVDYRLHPPRRGDIVILTGPQDATQDFVKRIIGLPGDHVLIKGGFVYIDDHQLRESYLGRPWTQTTTWPSTAFSPADGEVVPADNFFVLGDNRDHSGDSRLFGYVSVSQILGRVVARVSPRVSTLGS